MPEAPLCYHPVFVAGCARCEMDKRRPISSKQLDQTADAKDVDIKAHSGNKYLRTIVPPRGCEPGQTDVYAVLEAFNVRCPAVQHAVKKLLCAGLRNKASRAQDLREAVDALRRAIEMEEARPQ